MPSNSFTLGEIMNSISTKSTDYCLTQKIKFLQTSANFLNVQRAIVIEDSWLAKKF